MADDLRLRPDLASAHLHAACGGRPRGLSPRRSRAARPQIGDNCVLNTDCGSSGTLVCDTSQPNGYCTQFNCTPERLPEQRRLRGVRAGGPRLPVRRLPLAGSRTAGRSAWRSATTTPTAAKARATSAPTRASPLERHDHRRQPVDSRSASRHSRLRPRGLPPDGGLPEGSVCSASGPEFDAPSSLPCPTRAPTRAADAGGDGAPPGAVARAMRSSTRRRRWAPTVRRCSPPMATLDATSGDGGASTHRATARPTRVQPMRRTAADLLRVAAVLRGRGARGGRSSSSPSRRSSSSRCACCPGDAARLVLGDQASEADLARVRAVAAPRRAAPRSVRALPPGARDARPRRLVPSPGDERDGAGPRGPRPDRGARGARAWRSAPWRASRRRSWPAARGGACARAAGSTAASSAVAAAPLLAFAPLATWALAVRAPRRPAPGRPRRRARRACSSRARCSRCPSPRTSVASRARPLADVAARPVPRRREREGCTPRARVGRPRAPGGRRVRS